MGNEDKLELGGGRLLDDEEEIEEIFPSNSDDFLEDELLSDEQRAKKLKRTMTNKDYSFIFKTIAPYINALMVVCIVVGFLLATLFIILFNQYGYIHLP